MSTLITSHDWPMPLNTQQDLGCPLLPLYCHPDSMAALKNHLLNNPLWLDFTRLSSPEQPALKIRPLTTDTDFSIPGTVFNLTGLEVMHRVPALGCTICHGNKKMAFPNDAHGMRPFWEFLKRQPPDALILDCQYLDDEVRLSVATGHNRPETLGRDVRRFLSAYNRLPKLLISHLRPWGRGVAGCTGP
jgi:hypothetical protein